MMGGHLTGKMPFETVYIHGLVRDENNKKMSKTANNGIDPLILIDKYGTDALRYTLIREVAGAGQDIRLEYNRQTDESASVEASRNFANKLWNAARFVMMNLDGKTPAELGSPLILIAKSDPNGMEEQPKEGLELCDRWILSRFHQVVRQTNDNLDNYALGEAAKGLYEFIWGDFCDWYIELVKSRLRQEATSPTRVIAQKTLAYVLEGILKLLHPFMPHITEEIWHSLTQKSTEVLALQPLPESCSSEVESLSQNSPIDSRLEEEFALLISTIRTIRNLRAEAGIKRGVKVSAILQSEESNERQIMEAGKSYIQDLAEVQKLTIAPSLTEEIKTTMAGVVGTTQVLIPLAGVVDVEDLRAKLTKNLGKVEGEAKSISSRLANENFVRKAPPQVVESAKNALSEALHQAEILRNRINRL